MSEHIGSSPIAPWATEHSAAYPLSINTAHRDSRPRIALLLQLYQSAPIAGKHSADVLHGLIPALDVRLPCSMPDAFLEGQIDSSSPPTATCLLMGYIDLSGGLSFMATIVLQTEGAQDGRDLARRRLPAHIWTGGAAERFGLQRAQHARLPQQVLSLGPGHPRQLAHDHAAVGCQLSHLHQYIPYGLPFEPHCWQPLQQKPFL